MLKLSIFAILAMAVLARYHQEVLQGKDEGMVIPEPKEADEEDDFIRPEPKESELDQPEPKTFKCGQAPLYENQRIINGTYVPARGSFPFMVNIKIGWQHWCGGAVYDKFTVISAAHCFWHGQNMHDLKLFFADFNQKVGYNYEIGQELRKVKSITKHPQYDQYWQNNDIAILKMTEELPFTNKIQPICMPTVEVTGGEDTITMGWGYTYGTSDDNKLTYVHVPVIPRETCRKRDWYSVAVNEHMICAGYEEGMIDSCQGDSGGPLALKNSEGAFELIGVVSWGSGCAKKKNPGVYTDVYDYRDWIREVAGEPKY
ncbi:trypsin-2-like [Convolutriloba macropyga]|uniref:trypsin-2-like n=1 Tax=Convolutriloba macropyga TaxID=536237 RepID=UPI003F51CD4C